MLETSDDELPVFDIGAFAAAAPTERAELVAGVDDALGSMGFLVLVGHGIDPAAFDDARERAREFFALDLDVKMEHLPTAAGAPGFYPVKAGSLARTMGLKRSPDLKESFTIGPVDRPPARYSRQADAYRWFPQNRWPAVDRMRESWTALYRQASVVARQLLQVFEVASDQPDGAFTDRCLNETSTLSAIHYPPQPPSHYDRARAGPHSDYGTFTMLHKAPDSDRLEILRDDGEWVAVAAPPGGLIVNIGDLMTRWVGDRWVSRACTGSSGHRPVWTGPAGAASRSASSTSPTSTRRSAPRAARTAPAPRPTP